MPETWALGTICLKHGTLWLKPRGRLLPRNQRGIAMGSIDFSGLLYAGIVIGVVVTLILIGIGSFLMDHVSVVIR